MKLSFRNLRRIILSGLLYSGGFFALCFCCRSPSGEGFKAALPFLLWDHHGPPSLGRCLGTLLGGHA